MNQIKTALNRNEHPNTNHKCVGISATIPDQTMTLRTIVGRYANGESLGGTNAGALWDDHDTQMGINPKTLDLVDIQELAEQTKKTLKSKKAEGTNYPLVN